MAVAASVILAAFVPTSARAQDDDRAARRAALEDWGDEPRRRRVTIDDRDGGDESAGIGGRLGHIGFKTFGRNDSITHAELLPYVMMDAHMLFNNSRFFTTNEGKIGGNIGLGYRYLEDSWDRVFGGSLWYDLDDTTGFLFHQAGLSLETYGELWDARANFYLPVADTETTYVRGLTATRFRGTSVLYDQLSRIGVAMKGVDVEAGGLFPGRFSKDHKIRGYAGLYHFEGDDAENIDGVKGRVEANVTDWFFAVSEVTHDNTFGTNVTLGAAFQFSGGDPASKTMRGSNTDKLRRFSQRNYNVIVSHRVQRDYDLTAINPATGQPFRVAHLDTAAVGANNGTVEDPYTTLTLARAAGADLVFVHSGSMLGAPVALVAGERILGEGASHFLQIDHYGYVPLPNAGGGPRPTLLNAAGVGVTMANNSEFSGFVIDSPSSHGVLVSGVSGVRVSQVEILNAGGDGMRIENALGSMEFSGIHVQDAAGAGLRIDGGTPFLSFTGTIDNSAGRALVVSNTSASSYMNLLGTTVNDDGGTGVLLDTVGGNLLLGPMSLLNSTSTGLDIQGGTGNITIIGTTLVQNAAGAGINIDGAAGNVSFQNAVVDGGAGQVGVNVANSTGRVRFGNLDVDSNGGTALVASNNAGGLAVDAGRLAGVNAAAADISNTDATVRLTSVSASNAAFGVSLNNVDGTFFVLGNGTAGSGGTIENSTVGLLIQNSGTAAFQYLNLDGNGVGAQVSATDGFELSRSSVTNSASHGIDALNVRQLFVNGSVFTGNGGVSVRAVASVLGSYDYRIVNNLINGPTSSGIDISSTGAGDTSSLALQVVSNTITVGGAGSGAVRLDWSGTIAGSFRQNAISGTGGLNNGFDVNARSNAHLAQLEFSGNDLDFSGGTDTAIRVVAAGPSRINVGTNLIDFNAADGTGMFFDLAESADVNIQTNTITDNATGATGIHFFDVDGPTTIAINNNWIRLPGAGIDRGIIFGTVGDPITLSGSQNNLIEDAAQTFFIPANESTGRIYVNGVAVP